MRFKSLEILLAVVCIAVGNKGWSQTDTIGYPQNYFRNPLGIPIQLAANFGELRNNHFHMGLDIRTNQRENLPVYAAAEGYVSRIKIEQYGFGRAIYITHPNGFTTLYAHLNEFFPALEEYLESVQYQQKSWEQDLYIPPGMFPVTKGQFIAKSGNTGGSAGPHLHFEIRETYTEHNLNPLLFNMPVPDNIPPFITRLYLYDRRYSTYQKSPRPITITKTGKNYTAREVIVTSSPRVSFGISAGDKANRSFNFGIYRADLLVDENLVSSFSMNDFSYPQSRYINASTDYASRAKGGPWIQHLSQLPGNQSPIFENTPGDGIVTLTDTDVHNVNIIVQDAMNNEATLRFKIRYQPKDDGLMSTANYIWMQPGQPNQVSFQNVEAFFTPATFYDTVHFVTSSKPATDARAVSEKISLHNYTVPVHDSFLVRIKPSPGLTAAQKSKVVVQLTSNKKKVGLKGIWNNGWVEGKFRDLGDVQLLVDTVPPRVATQGWVNGANLSRHASLTLLADDDLSDLTNFTAEVDGEWLMFRRKNDFFIYDFDERVPKGRHTLKVSATDAAGNVTVKTFTFSR